MEITDIKIKQLTNEGKMKSIVSVTFDDALAVHDIKIIGTQDKLFVAMPNRKAPDGTFRDIVHPINSRMREQLEQAILAKYREALEQAQTQDTAAE